ncbi:MAG: DUF2214 family protein [Gemmatimonadetes bacterium]|nr:DUF2214 family protein [Gemmatimonadota bacterium]
MLLRWLLASLHLLGLGIGLGAIWVRSRALAGAPDPACVRRALRADAWWGVAALLWLGTGLPRLLLGLEKPVDSYFGGHIFWLKLGLFTLVFLLELGPMVGLTLWRIALKRGTPLDTRKAAQWATTGRVQVALVVVLVFVATAMARGFDF